MKMTDTQRILATIADHFMLADEEMEKTDDRELRMIYSIVRARIYDILEDACDGDEGTAEALLDEAAKRFMEQDAKLYSAALYGRSCYD